MDSANRICKICSDTQPLEQFALIRKEKGRETRRRTCAKCRADQIRATIASSPEKYLQSWLRRGTGPKEHRQVTVTLEELVSIWVEQAGRCAVTSMAMTYAPKLLKKSTGLNLSVDRIDPEKHYTKKNIRLVCHRVNIMRSAGDDSELLWWCKQVSTGIEND